MCRRPDAGCRIRDAGPLASPKPQKGPGPGADGHLRFEGKKKWCAVWALILAFGFILCSCRRGEETSPFHPGGEMPPGDRIRVLFGGDTAFAESYGDTQRRLLEEKGYDFPLAGVRPLLEKVDLAVCNLETPITNLDRSPHAGKKAYIHRSCPNRAPEAYQENRMLAFSLANNHTLDYGLEGLAQTLAALEGKGLAWFGAGLTERESEKPLLREFSKGALRFRLAVIGAFQYAGRYDRLYDFYADGEKGGCKKLGEYAVRKQIADIRAEHPGAYVVVFPHWGENYRWRTPAQTALGRAMIRSGADLVVGHGAHAMQEIERYRGKWILYGLGNFVFLSEGRYGKEKYPPYSFAAELLAVDRPGRPDIRVRLYPIHSDNLRTGFQPRPLGEDEFEDFCRILRRKSPLTSSDAAAISWGREGGAPYLQLNAE